MRLDVENTIGLLIISISWGLVSYFLHLAFGLEQYISIIIAFIIGGTYGFIFPFVKFD